ncbi:MAG TPA: hypothetical protein VLE72_02095 [Candidatus Saccharimonadales bacterium]|nr:hypothetical protein [Candidatus Saccharimonadales bacterium]
MNIKTLIIVNILGFGLLVCIVIYVVSQVKVILEQILDNAREANIKADRASQKAAEAQNIVEAQLRVRGQLRNPLLRDDNINDH